MIEIVADVARVLKDLAGNEKGEKVIKNRHTLNENL
jgi:hypothetical protein